jgi:hypothetical protein
MYLFPVSSASIYIHLAHDLSACIELFLYPYPQCTFVPALISPSHLSTHLLWPSLAQDVLPPDMQPAASAGARRLASMRAEGHGQPPEPASQTSTLLRRCPPPPRVSFLPPGPAFRLAPSRPPVLVPLPFFRVTARAIQIT